MYFTIVENFSPSAESWKDYCAWRGIEFERFDSIDGILRPSLFTTPEGEDWNYVVQEDFRLHLITDLDYARRKRSMIGSGDLVGIRFDRPSNTDSRFLGFDLIDGYFDISLLTNFGNDINLINQLISVNALVLNRRDIEQIQEHLLSEFPDDPHVKRCQIVSIYNVDG
jgi:hypothetical protein